MSSLLRPRISKTQQKKDTNRRLAKALRDHGKDEKQAYQDLIRGQLPF
jgi:hypothetical protein